MKTIATIDVYQVQFPKGYQPCAVPASLSIIEANGRNFLRTPSAFLDHATPATVEELRRLAPIMGYHLTEDDARAEIDRRYPHWSTPEAQTIMSRINDATRWHGDLVGIGQLADAVGVSRERLHDLARGKIRPTKKQAQAAADYHGKAV